jgi:thiol:disulfide interchange protein DsbD
VIAAIFLSIGLGLATPFVAAAASPAIARRMPRSGAWMADLRAVLGFALLLTVVWLLWVLGRVSGADAIAPALALLLAIAAASWTLGLAQRRGRSVSGFAIAAVLGAIAAPGIVTLDLAPDANVPAAPAIAARRAFSPDAVRASLAAGHPVFVYFTADWCLTCKVNERTLVDPRVEPELARTATTSTAPTGRAATRRSARARRARQGGRARVRGLRARRARSPARAARAARRGRARHRAARIRRCADRESVTVAHVAGLWGPRCRQDIGSGVR